MDYIEGIQNIVNALVQVKCHRELNESEFTMLESSLSLLEFQNRLLLKQLEEKHGKLSQDPDATQM